MKKLAMLSMAIFTAVSVSSVTATAETWYTEDPADLSVLSMRVELPNGTAFAEVAIVPTDTCLEEAELHLFNNYQNELNGGTNTATCVPVTSVHDSLNVLGGDSDE